MGVALIAAGGGYRSEASKVQNLVNNQLVHQLDHAAFSSEACEISSCRPAAYSLCRSATVYTDQAEI